MLIKYTNKEILDLCKNISLFLHTEEIKFPIYISYALNSNFKKIMLLSEEIEEAKIKIGERYGELDKENSSTYKILPANIEKADEELKELSKIEHSIDIIKIKLSAFKESQLTLKEMQALEFMIEDDIYSNQEDKVE